MVLVVLALLIAIYTLSGQQDEAPRQAPAVVESRSPEDSSASTGRPVVVESGSGDEAELTVVDEPEVAEPVKPRDEWTAADYHAAGEAPPMQEIPPEILEDFRRAMAPIPEEERAVLESGMEPMPDRIRQDFERATDPDIPPAIRADFENPYPPMPPGHEVYFPEIANQSTAGGTD
jgi:hypothetical protein